MVTRPCHDRVASLKQLVRILEGRSPPAVGTLPHTLAGAVRDPVESLQT